MKVTPWTSWVLLATTLAGCEFVHPPTAIGLEMEPVVVHSVLSGGSEHVTVLVTQVGPDTVGRPGEPSFIEPGIKPISGAEVAVIAGGEVVRLIENAVEHNSCLGGLKANSGPGCYVARVSGRIRPGTPYHLEIRLPDGRTISGTATPPPAATLLGPEANSRISVRWSPQGGFTPAAELSVRVLTAPEVAGVGVMVRPAQAFLDGVSRTDLECAVSMPLSNIPVEWIERASWGIHALVCSRGEGSDRHVVRPDSVHARLFVTAYDSTFMRYQTLLRKEQVTLSEAAEGISGALGLFAGETTVERIITLVPRD